MDIIRITARWTGFPGAPGYSNFHFSTNAGFFDGGLLGDEAEAAAQSAANRVRNAFIGINSLTPSAVSIKFEAEAPVIDSDSGEILGAIPISLEDLTPSGNSDGFSGATGAVVNWRTNDYRFGRRIRGRTFIVPLAGTQYESDGTLNSSALSTLRGFGSDIVSGGDDPQFGVWSRPRNGAGGVFASVVSSSVPDLAAVLRSRRD